MTKCKLLSSVCLAAMTLGTASAQASGPDEGSPHHHRHWYASLYGGWATALDHKFDFVTNTTGTRFGYTVSHDDGYTVGGAIGIVYSPNVRFEVELSHSKFDYSDNYRSVGFIGLNESGTMTLTTVLANVWFNADFGFAKPYIGGGIGVGMAEGNLTVSNGAGRQFSGDDTSIAFQLGGGLRFNLSKNLELDLGYRLKHLPDINFASAITGFSTSSSDLTTHAVQAGINFKF